MYRASKFNSADLVAFYGAVNGELRHLIEYEDDWLAILANAAAILRHQLDEINWVGFYLLKNEVLVLGPFQGLPACSTITLGSGVCGAAVATMKTMVVDDVHEFPGHIACDEA
ncbi:MAG: GAF domain-containing protein, partial [bacterium]|nr:GAF domain-containing protein [bacterium]